MHDIDLTPIWQVVIPMAAGVLSIFGSLALNKLTQKLGIEKNSAQRAALDDIAMKAIQAGAMASQHIIVAKGWDHLETQSAIIATAARYATDKFTSVLAKSGIDPSTPEGQQSLKDLVTRALPAGVTLAAASPATPPVPDEQKTAIVAAIVSPAAAKV